MVEVEGGWSHYPGSGGVFLKAEVCRRNLVTALRPFIVPKKNSVDKLEDAARRMPRACSWRGHVARMWSQVWRLAVPHGQVWHHPHSTKYTEASPPASLSQNP